MKRVRLALLAVALVMAVSSGFAVLPSVGGAGNYNTSPNLHLGPRAILKGQIHPTGSAVVTGEPRPRTQ